MSKIGIKFDKGKPRVGLIPPEPLLEIGKVLSFGAERYKENNWCNGLKYERLISAALRHINSFQKGDPIDNESQCHHLAHAATNLLFLLQFEIDGRTDLDDRMPQYRIKKARPKRKIKKST